MLFDLRGRGRQNTVKIVYIALAFLMGGGLVLFGIGGATSGGLVDAITGNGSGGNTGAKRFETQIKQANAALAKDRQSEKAWVDLIRAQVGLAGTNATTDPSTGQTTYSAKGKTQLNQAIASWKAYLAINPKNAADEASVASRVAQAFSALNDANGTMQALEIVAEQRNTSGTWAAYAAAAYGAGNARVGDLAGKKAVALESPDQRNQLRGELDSYKQQAGLTASPTPAITPAPSAAATKTAAPKKKSKAKK